MIYVLHFDRAYKHARHYTGFSETASTLPDRILAHARGQGARLMRVLADNGIGFRIGAIMPGDRTAERKLKNTAHPERHCSICKNQGQEIDFYHIGQIFLPAFWGARKK